MNPDVHVNNDVIVVTALFYAPTIFYLFFFPCMINFISVSNVNLLRGKQKFVLFGPIT